jgi:Helicase conserved C-terminal domain
MVLHKRSLSSARSVAQTIERRLAALGAPEGQARQLFLPLDDENGELDAADAAPALLMPLLADEHREQRLLTAIKEAADAASASESKIHRLMALLHRLRRRGHRAIVFTEYRDTLLHVRAQLPFEAAAVLHGGLARKERRAALDQFLSGRASILLATDAAGEGLNLQAHCRVVINLELPWSPTRLEQRIGRVDRIGQRQTVHVWHLLAGETGEIRLLDRLRARLAEARSQFDVADPLVSAAGAGVFQAANGHRPTHTRVVRLDTDARNECVALARARSLIRSGGSDTLPAGPPGPAVAFARGRLRHWLQARALVLFRSTIEDGASRPLAVQFTALLMTPDVARHYTWRPVVTELLELGARVLRTMDDSLPSWERDALRCHTALWHAQLAREDAILDVLRARPGIGLQPGLFDRRAERERAASVLEERLLIDQITTRRALAVRAAGAHALRVDPVLILLPPN